MGGGPFINPIDPDGTNVMGPMVPGASDSTAGAEEPPVVSTAKESSVCIAIAIGI